MTEEMKPVESEYDKMLDAYEARFGDLFPVFAVPDEQETIAIIRNCLERGKPITNKDLDIPPGAVY